MTNQLKAPPRREIASPSTIHDVARVAGVSARTVSRVINDLPRVSPQTRERILEVIRELSFSPNLRARALANNRSYLLGLVHTDPNSENVDQVHRGLFRVCMQHQYEVIAHPIEGQLDLVEDVLGFVRRSRVDGLVVMAPSSEDALLADVLLANQIATAAVAAAALPHFGLMLVTRDRAASANVAAHLLELGHRRVGLISGPLTQLSARERQHGFVAALKDAGVSVAAEWMSEGDYSFESGVACARRLLARDSRPTAIYACNDRMAAGVLTVAADLGIRVPEQLSVVGFDDTYLASVLNPALTTVNRPLSELGRRAGEWLVDIQTRERSERHDSSVQYVDLELVHRRSTAKPPSGSR